MIETRDHGGNLDAAIARWGGARADWLDLSTGINPVPYPVPPIPPHAWAALPTRAETLALEQAARTAYGTPAECVALAGAQAAIQLVPRLAPPGLARILGPTYNEHAASLVAQGWRVETVPALAALAGADLAVVVNPNNPDGQRHAPGTLAALADRVGLLVVDESFADPEPALSLATRLPLEKVLILRSFGKFYGLAGVRLGFALGSPDRTARLRALSGPWSASGPAIALGTAALSDTAWRHETTARLTADADRLDALAAGAGWRLVGGTPLFRSYATPDATAAQDNLASHRIWSRIFPYSADWIRLGLPPPEGWPRLAEALSCR
ncbi:threonine-phosphate decarboxylase CobD [Thetidibacter halocola]|uniref:threonine-phosphate decarboxylase n=1 Tax=Thetidibacter halocola TaxID=2827239 RepID=A0A8J7WAJ9_9RHOB|nr:threonine-phosphate decarboxylase CobD [Thetidibacter halocola]MBS0123997.1 threonine-phosphate decarboxylase [Thetidibacter halocola]